MLDWNTTDDDKPFAPPSDSNTTAPHRRRWGMWVVVIFLMVAVSGGGVYLNQRVQRGDDAMRQDLLLFVRREEQARRLGQADQFQTFLATDTPADFVTDYRKLFQPSPTPGGVEVTLEEFALEGETAQVVVGLGGQRQRRAYRLTAEGWRRVPLVAEWGEEQTAVIGPNSVLLTFYSSDSDFAHQLETDLPLLFDEFKGVVGGVDPQATIRIEPRELASAIYQSSQSADMLNFVTLNSPQVVEMPGRWTLSGEAAIRYTLAIRLWSSLSVVEEQFVELPRAGRFMAASFQVRALRWATAHEPELYNALVESWRATADGWRSPFDSGVDADPALDPFAPGTAEAGMLLVANTVYEEAGTSWLAFQSQVLNGQPDSWDAVFENISNESTREVEARARGDSTTATLPSLPLTGQMTAEGVSDEEAIFHIAVEGYDQPIAVEGVQDAHLIFLPPDGSNPEPVQSLCVGQFPRVTLQGEWREEGLRFATTEMSMNAADFPDPAWSHTIPSDTVAYLQEVDETGTQAYISAMNAAGETTPILTNAFDFSVGAPLNSTGMSGLFVIRGAYDPTCGIFQLAWYPFDGGETARWYMLGEAFAGGVYPYLVWDDAAQRGLLLLSAFDDDRPIPYWHLSPDDNRFLREPDGVLPPGQMAAVSPALEEVLIRTGSGSILERISIATRDVVGRYSIGDSFPAQVAVYSNDGRTVLVGWRNNTGDAYQLMLYDVERDTYTTIDTSAYLSIFAARPDVENGGFYLLMGHADSATSLVRLETNNQITSIESITGPNVLQQQFACRGGGAAYWVSRPVPGAITDMFSAPQTLTFVTADGEPRYPPITLPPNSLPLVCE